MFERLIVPLASPYTDDTSSVSEIRFARLVRFHRDRGAAGFVVTSDAGEWWALAHSERKTLVEWAVREAHGLPVFVHVTASTTSAMIDLCQHAERHGARGAVFSMPPYGPFSPDEVRSAARGLRRHGNLAAGFLGTERIDEGGEAGLGLAVRSLDAVGFGAVALSRGATSEEGEFGGEVVSPLGVFGAQAARALVVGWGTAQIKVKALFAHGRSVRVAKAFCEEQGLDIGPPRGPVHSLDPRGRELLAAVSALL